MDTEQLKVIVYADGIRDDTDAIERIMNNEAVGIRLDGRLLNEAGGTCLITRTIDLTTKGDK